MANNPAEEGAFLLVNLYAADLMMRSENLYKSSLLTKTFDDLKFLNQAVHYARKVLELVPLLHRDRYSMIQYNLARLLLRRCMMARMVIKWLAKFNADFNADQDVMKESETFRNALLSEANRVSRNEDLLEAIEKFRNALVMLTDDAVRLKCIFYYNLCYWERDGKFDGFAKNDFEDDEKFDYLWAWLHEDSGKSRLRSPVSLDVIRLDSKIQIFREAVKFFSWNSDPVKRGDMLSQLGWHLRLRFLEQRKLEDIDEALKCCCFDLQEVLPTSPWFVVTHLNIACYITLSSFELLGRREDLDNGVGYANRAMEVVDSQDPMFIICLYNRASAMLLRYLAAGDEKDLDAALDTSMRAVRIAERLDVELPRSEMLHYLVVDDPKFFDMDLPRMLSNLETTLVARFQRSGRSEHLIEAIKATQKASDLMPPKDLRQIRLLTTLTHYKVHLFKILREVEDLTQGSQHLKEAESIISDLADRGCEVDGKSKLYLITGRYNYEEFLESFFVESDMSLTSLDEIIGQARDLTSQYNDLKSGPSLAVESHTLLCRALFNRWKKTDTIEHIDEAIHRVRRTIDIVGDRADHFVKARERLGKFLYDRFKRKGGDDDRKEALAVLLEGFRMSAGAPLHRIEAGQLAIDILSEMAEWDSAHELTREILDLLVIVNTRSLNWQDKQLVSSTFLTKAATYASIALQAGSDVFNVIELLERWRGSILGHLIDDRSDLDDLTRTEEGCEKAERFRELRNEINTVIDPSGDMVTRVEQADRRIKTEGEIRACLEEIRTLEGFHRFMLGPTQREVQAAAARGPIVIVNISSIRSDAIIITKDASVLLPLLKLEYQEVKKYDDEDLTNFSDVIEKGKKNKKYVKLQKWLWDNCVKLIFEKLDDLAKLEHSEISASVPSKSHVWWIAIGIASFLPFHAAGVYTPGNFSETALSRAISSYTPSLKVLIHGRRKLKADPTEPDVQCLTSKPAIQQLKPRLRPRLAVIIMPSTPDDMAPLEGVEEEAAKIQEIVGDTYLTKLRCHPSAGDTMALMAECEVVHFACHAKSTFPFTFNSHLLLQATPPDSTMPVIDELKLSAVAATDLSHGKLAFLSACSTAQNRAPDLRDEALHLTSGFQVAGYLHAIGNLWLTEDEVSVLLVKGFYKHLVAAGELGDGDNVAKSLNEALTGIASLKIYAKRPLSWAQFVHFGV